VRGALPRDGAPLGCVLRPHGGEGTYAYTTTGALRGLGFVPDRRGGQARGRTEEGVLW
jgi:hypothetical protein